MLRAFYAICNALILIVKTLIIRSSFFFVLAKRHSNHKRKYYFTIIHRAYLVDDDNLRDCESALFHELIAAYLVEVYCGVCKEGMRRDKQTCKV